MSIRSEPCPEPRLLPLDEQRQILRATLQLGPNARDQAIEWLPQADIDGMGFDSLRLMPQLYDRLRTEAISHPLLPRLKGLKRRAWLKNQLLLHRASDAVRILQQAGIEVIVIKGMALIIGYYHDYSLRPMNDVDLLVPYQKARTACQILAEYGWKNEYEDSENPHLIEQAFRYLHATHLTDSLKRDLDLHWNLLEHRLGPAVDEDFWTACGEASLGVQKTRILHPADQILHICVHGTGSPPIRWVPDVLAVIRHEPDLDWNRLLSQARKRGLTGMIGGALGQIQRDFPDQVPTEVVAELLGSHLSFFERYEYWQLREPGTPLFGWLSHIIYRFLCRSAGSPLLLKPHLFLEFLCFEWKVLQKKDLPGAFWRRATRKAAAHFGALAQRRSGKHAASQLCSR